MESLEIPRETYQIPFTTDRFKTTQEKLPKSHDRLDNPEYRFHSTLPPGIKLSPFGRLESMVHGGNSIGILR